MSQLENDSLGTKNSQYEHSVVEAGIEINNLKRELEFQKTKCAGLESSISMLKNIPRIEPKQECPVATNNHERTIKTLKQKLANEEKISQRLLEEKDGLYAENLKLMQSKLDDLFNSEQQFNTVKASMAMEIRSLESENAKLKKELQNMNSSSENSDDTPFDKISNLLDNEISARKQLDIKLVELENLNVKFENEIKTLRMENEVLNRENSKYSENNLQNEDIKRVSEDLLYVKNCLNAITQTFQGEYYKILSNMESSYSSTINALENSNRKFCNEINILKQQEKEFNTLKGDFENAKKSLNILVNENENLQVNLKLLNRENEELKEHCKKLEISFNERESVIDEIRIQNNLLINDLNLQRNNLEKQINFIQSELENLLDDENEIKTISNENKELKINIEVLNARVSELSRENKKLRDYMSLFDKVYETIEKFYTTRGTDSNHTADNSNSNHTDYISKYFQ